MKGKNLVVPSRIRSYVKEREKMKVSADVETALDSVIFHTLNRAMERAKAEHRVTLLSRDIQQPVTQN